MHSAKLTMNKYLLIFFVACGWQVAAFAQENSPYSRYGIGDLNPNQNIISRAMGGISAGMADSVYRGFPKTNWGINFVNPASLGNITNTILDIGAEADFRTLKSKVPAARSSSSNSLFSYLQLAFPIASKKMVKHDMNWGVSVGLRPVSSINYKIEKNERVFGGADSLNTVYEGTGGINQAFIGTGFRIKNLSIGVNFGYMFGSKDYSTKLSFMNDTVMYAQSNSANNTTFGDVFYSGGIQYVIPLKNYASLRLGAYGNLQQNIGATTDIVRETYQLNSVTGEQVRVDSVYEQKGVKGTLKLPSSFGAGFTYQDMHWTFGADFEATNWSSYRYFGQADDLQNSWTIRAGAQYYPAKENTSVRNYFSFVKYRAGFYYGPDYVKLDNINRPNYGITIGTGMPLTSLQRISYFGDIVMLNTALEISNRGNNNTNLRENVVRFSIGVSMNAHWFVKPKYN